jgi:phosphate-selective porin OprO and OprP
MHSGGEYGRDRLAFAWFVAALLCCRLCDAQELPVDVFSDTEPGLIQNVAAEAPPPLPAALDETNVDGDDPVTVEALLERLRVLEEKDRLRTAAEAQSKRADALKKADEAAKAAAWTDVSSDKWTVKLGGHVQIDYVNWAQADDVIEGDQDYVEFRRLRLVADGTGYGVYDFRLQMTLEPDVPGDSSSQTPQVKDAYFSINEVPFLGRIRIGNFFVPFSLEQVTNDTNNIFVERSIPTQGIFAADREVGLAIYNSTEDQRMTLTTGMFFEGVSESAKALVDDNQGYRLVTRATWLPYYDEPSNGRYLVHTGIGLLHTQDQDRSLRFRARPHVRQSPRLIDSGVLPGQSSTTVNAEGAIVWGRFTLQTEAFLSHLNLDNAPDETIGGAYAHVSYFLTGENRVFEKFGQHGPQFGRIAPNTNVFATPGGCGWGAWELKSRISYLSLDNVSAGEYHDYTVGMNWYWSDRVRMMFDWIHPITSDDTVFGSTQSDLLSTRFDFNW